MPSSYEQSPCAVAGALSRLHLQALQARLAPHRASAAQFPVLQCLWERDGQTQSELCRSLSVEQPTLANTLNRMVRDNLIRKVKDSNDRRQVIIRLTKRGQELEEVLTGSVREVLDAAEAGIEPAELQTFLDVARRMSDNLRQDLDQPPMVLDEPLAEATPGGQADSSALFENAGGEVAEDTVSEDDEAPTDLGSIATVLDEPAPAREVLSAPQPAPEEAAASAPQPPGEDAERTPAAPADPEEDEVLVLGDEYAVES